MTMQSETEWRSRPGFPWGLTIAAVIAFAVLCGLGTWQVRRMAWKRDLISRIGALQHAPARPIAAVLADAEADRDLAYMRVSVNCPGLSRAPFVRLYSLKDGEAGERLLSACRLPDGRSLLVDRGFLPDGARAPITSAAQTDAQPFEVTGVLRRPDAASIFTPRHRPGGRWFARDLPAMARELSAPDPIPYFLAVETRTNPEDTALIPAPIPTEISNRHLGYVITWFGLAAALVGVYVSLLRQRMKGLPA
jgi:surfeit locus 1 family protein